MAPRPAEVLAVTPKAPGGLAAAREGAAAETREHIFRGPGVGPFFLQEIQLADELERGFAAEREKAEAGFFEPEKPATDGGVEADTH